MQRKMVKRLIELGYAGSNASNKKPKGCDQQQVKEEPKIEHLKITSEQEREVLKAKHNESMKELSEWIEAWKPFKDEQGPSWKETSINTVNNANTRKETMKDGTKKFLTSDQHNSKIEVTNPHTISASNN